MEFYQQQCKHNGLLVADKTVLAPEEKGLSQLNLNHVIFNEYNYYF